MKIVENKYIPPKGFIALNLFGVIFCRDASLLTRVVKNHEKIHTEQMKELLYVLYYIWYFIEWLLKLIWYLDSHAAYRNISFEREAYKKEKNLAYISKREKYAWLKYVFNF